MSNVSPLPSQSSDSCLDIFISKITISTTTSPSLALYVTQYKTKQKKNTSKTHSFIKLCLK